MQSECLLVAAGYKDSRLCSNTCYLYTVEEEMDEKTKEIKWIQVITLV